MGNDKIRQTMIAKYGKDYWTKIGAAGGKAKVPKGLAMLSQKQRVAIAKKGAETRWHKNK